MSEKAESSPRGLKNKTVSVHYTTVSDTYRDVF